MTSHDFRAATSISGTIDIATGISDQPELVVFDPRDPSETRMRSPMLFSGSFKCPTRLFHGDEESHFLGETRDTVTGAKSVGLDVESFVMPGDHFTCVPLAVTKSIEFFRSKL